jgi:segregation and condensation protein B
MPDASAADAAALVAVAESVVAASARPVTVRELQSALPEGSDVAAVMSALVDAYEGRGIVPVFTAGGWTFRTRQEASARAVETFGERHRLGRAATETLTCIALFGPVTRSEIERVRGVALSKGTMDALLSASLIRPGPRRNGPGRPLTWIATERFLELYHLDGVRDVPEWQQIRDEGLDDLRRTGGAPEEAPAAEDAADGDAEPEGDPFDDERQA